MSSSVSVSTVSVLRPERRLDSALEEDDTWDNNGWLEVDTIEDNPPSVREIMVRVFPLIVDVATEELTAAMGRWLVSVAPIILGWLEFMMMDEEEGVGVGVAVVVKDVDKGEEIDESVSSISLWRSGWV